MAIQADLRKSDEESGFRVRYIFYFALILLAFLAVFSYSPADGAAISGGIAAPPPNWIGNLGAGFSFWLFQLTGLAAYVLLLLTLLRVVRAILPGGGRPWLFLLGEAMLVFGLMLLLALSPNPFAYLTDKLGIGRIGLPELALSGGAIGQILAAPAVESLDLPEGALRQLIGTVGTLVLGWALLTGGLVIIYLADWHQLFRNHVFNAPDLPEADRQPQGNVVPEHRFAPMEPDSPGNGLLGSARAALAALREKRGLSATPATAPAAEQSVDTPEIVPGAPRSPAATGQQPLPPPPPDLAVLGVPAPAPAGEPPVETIPTPSPVPVPAPAPAASAGTGRTPEQTPAMQPRPVAATPPAAAVNVKITQHGQQASAVREREYVLPPISMLSKGSDAVGEAPEAIERATLLLQRTLDSFKIPGTVVGHISGPRITRYEISLAEGVNVKKVEQIASNIAMNLAAPSIRVLAPIPGRNVVGVEVPNTRSEAVFMRAVMETDAWNGKAAIPIVLGKDVASRPVVLDLAKAPHLLIAGSTGSGKSVCMNTLIMSLLFKFSPDDLRLIMVDPKIVEFEDYKKLPHLITPVINDAKKVPIALRWAVTEMENRYKILARAGVKKLAEFNALSHGEPILDSEGGVICDAAGEPILKMPILVVIIDELAELRMQDSWKDSETYIARIAQLGRASGVHIVVATQRPSTNIITGVIKANLPTRIAFRVMQLVDSRVILDVPGAENLLGMGDMLYLAPGGMSIDRVQGALVDDKDIKAIVKFVSEQRPQNFNAQVVAEEEAQDEEIDDNLIEYDEEDHADIAPLLKKYLRPGDDDNVKRALEVVILDRKASTSYIQRRLKIGYNRAAELMDLFEQRGIVGPPSGSGNKREILVFDGIEMAEE